MRIQSLFEKLEFLNRRFVSLSSINSSFDYFQKKPSIEKCRPFKKREFGDGTDPVQSALERSVTQVCVHESMFESTGERIQSLLALVKRGSSCTQATGAIQFNLYLNGYVFKDVILEQLRIFNSLRRDCDSEN